MRSSTTPAWSESYGYDTNLDYLTSASYGDSQPNSSQSWTYDAAGNRASDYTGSSWTYDNLNRMSANGAGTSLSNDILGNRTALGAGFSAGTYTWDCLNRLTATTGGFSSGGGVSAAHVAYEYRADGMRVEKVDHSGTYEIGAGEIDDQYAHYRYDGQMPMETSIVKANGSTEVIDNGLGARGLDYVHIVTTPTTGSPTTTIGFPIYDAHGNEVATIQRSGSSYVIGNQRSYGAWGEVRQGATTGGPRGRYCASLGHVQDDESGLVYMRARYYEASSGRFISEDGECQDTNWTLYCKNDPIDCFDDTGKFHTQGQFATQWYLIFYGAGLGLMSLAALFGTFKLKALCLWAVELSAMAFVGALGCTDAPTSSTIKVDAVEFFALGAGLGLMVAISEGLNQAAVSSCASIAVVSTAAYSTMLAAALFWCYEGS